MAENGRLPDSALAPIPGGRLRKDAAAAWNAPGGPADAGILPTGSESSYRTYDGQVKQRAYWCGRGLCGNAAEPGRSNHGLGICVDVKEPWMAEWLHEHGAKYGWAKVEAPNEWWHFSYVGLPPGTKLPGFESLKRGSKGKRVKRLTARLAYIHAPDDTHVPPARRGAAYLRRGKSRYGKRVEQAVRDFQADQDMHVDGVIGPRTAARIHGTFKRQYRRRHRKALPRGRRK